MLILSEIWLFWFPFGLIFICHISIYSLKRKLKNWRKLTWLKNHGRCLERQVVIDDQLTACLKKMLALTTPPPLVRNIHFIMVLNSRSIMVLNSRSTSKGQSKLWNTKFLPGIERDSLPINSFMLLRKFLGWDWLKAGKFIIVCLSVVQCCDTV